MYKYFLLVLTGFETNNKYDVQNTVGQSIFLAEEGEIIFVLCWSHLLILALD